MTLIRVNQLFSVLIICCLSVVLQSNYVDSAQGHFTNDFAVEIDGNMEVADLVAATHGFKLLRQVLMNIFWFRFMTEYTTSIIYVYFIVEKNKFIIRIL